MKKILSFLLIFNFFSILHASEIVIGNIGLAIGKITNQNGEVLKAGDKIYFGDIIKAEDQSKSQILLLDETVITIGSKTSVTLDEFIYDPNSQEGRITTNIIEGSVKVLSGKISEKNPDNLIVKTPAGSIGTRGTEFQAIVDEDEDVSKVLLIGPGQNNTLGLRPGAVEVFNDQGSVLLDTPFAFTEFAANQIPAPPVTITNEQLQEFQNFLDVREAGLENEEVQTAIKEGLFDDDQIGGNEIIGEIVQTALDAAGGGLTFDQIATVLGVSLEQLLGEDATEEFENESTENQIIMANAEGGDGLAYVLRYGGTDLGPTTGGDFHGISSGTYTYTANDVNMVASTGSGSGTFSATSVINFANKTVTNTYSGSVIVGSKDEVDFSFTTPSQAVDNDSNQVVIANYYSINSLTGAAAIDNNGSNYVQTDYEVSDNQYIADSATSYFNIDMNGSSNSPIASVGTLFLNIENYTTTDGVTTRTNSVNGQRAGIMPARN
ncbi:FecR family protein [Candidatus Pelagibacter sp.]|uniref:FecR family protein n=1 Tax=Candidatus Pelagibacter sp. TaxID=2024849 RepID=UPI003F84B949